MFSISKKVFGLAGVATVFAGMAFGQAASCGAPSAVGAGIIRAEGTTEQVAQLTFTCTSVAGQGAALPFNVQVFLSPSIPVTSKVLGATAAGTVTEATISVYNATTQAAAVTAVTAATTTLAASTAALVALQAVPGTLQSALTLAQTQITTDTTALTAAKAALVAASSVFQGTVSGSTINFVGTTPNAAVAAAGSLVFTVSNVRVNATSLSVGTGVPPSISETLFVNGGAVIPAALASTQVAFAQNGLASTRTWKVFTMGSTGLNNGVGSTSGANNFSNCISYSPKSDPTVATSATVAGKSLAGVIDISENFAQSFRTLADEAPQVAYASSALTVTSGTAASASNTAVSTRLRVNFANVPSGVTLYVPTVAIKSQNGGGAATIQWVTSDTGTTATSSDSLNTSLNGLDLKAVSISSGSGYAQFSVTADDLTNLDNFQIPVFISTTANGVAANATAFTTTVSFGVVGSTSTLPNFTVGASSNTVSMSSFSSCSTSLLFPFVTNQLGFDTGIAIANTSSDPFGTTGATAQAGTCSLNFYGSGAPSPASVTTPNVPTATVYTQVISGVAAGFQGYVIAQCNFQYAHGFAFITNGVGVNGGLSQGYLAGVIPDTNQVSRATTTGESLGAGQEPI